MNHVTVNLLLVLLTDILQWEVVNSCLTATADPTKKVNREGIHQAAHSTHLGFHDLVDKQLHVWFSFCPHHL